jgi:hypothetical protein
MLFCLTGVYVVLLLLSPPGWLPGEPVWAIQPTTLRAVLDESINFFFVLPLLNALGFNAIPAPMVYPVMQAFFNFAEAWIFMFLPLLLLDPRGRGLPRVILWSLAMFLTNIFLMPYMAARLWQEPATAEKPLPPPGRLTRIFGGIGIWVGLLAVVWGFFNRPDLGGLTDRLIYFAGQMGSNRVTLAFCIDLVLFCVFQAWLMGVVIESGSRWRGLRFVPFWGLALWLLWFKPASP